MAMKLNTGKVGFAIEFDNGDKEKIYFNPNDLDLAARLKGIESRVNKRFLELKDFNVDADGTPTSDDVMAEYEKARAIICEEIDISFDGDISSKVFKHCSPFALIDGEWFVVQFIKAIVPEIEKHNKKHSEEIKNKMSKHLDKYQK